MTSFPIGRSSSTSIFMTAGMSWARLGPALNGSPRISASLKKPPGEQSKILKRLVSFARSMRTVKTDLLQATAIICCDF